MTQPTPTTHRHTTHGPSKAAQPHISDLHTAFGRSPTNRHRAATGVHWACTFAIILGAMAAAGGIVGGLLWLGILGAVVMAVAAVIALGTGILENTEEYPAPRGPEG